MVDDEIRRGRGRPRSPNTLARDEAVLGVLSSEGRTRDQISELTGISELRVYESLSRLRRRGRVSRYRVKNTHFWTIKD